jgi:hypothetical protein
MAKRPSLGRGTTPIGQIVQFPKLNEPDYKFKEQGQFSIKLALSPEDAAPIIERCDEIAADKLAEAIAGDKKNAKKWETKYTPYEDETTDEGEPTGRVLIKATLLYEVVSKQPATLGKKYHFEPALFHANGEPFDKTTPIWGGTTAELAFEYRDYAVLNSGAGCSLNIDAVMIHRLISRGQQDAGTFGFSGSAVDSEADTNAAPDASGDDSDDDHSDF